MLVDSKQQVNHIVVDGSGSKVAGLGMEVVGRAGMEDVALLLAGEEDAA